MKPLISPEEIAEFKRILKKAREWDRAHNQPKCELEEKKKRLEDLAKELGATVSFDELGGA